MGHTGPVTGLLYLLPVEIQVQDNGLYFPIKYLETLGTETTCVISLGDKGDCYNLHRTLYVSGGPFLYQKADGSTVHQRIFKCDCNE